jgi:hypothetical protein
LIAIGELVADKDYQVWIEKVSDDNTIGFYIEDGTIVRPIDKVSEVQKIVRGQNEKETS